MVHSGAKFIHIYIGIAEFCTSIFCILQIHKIIGQIDLYNESENPR